MSGSTHAEDRRGIQTFDGTCFAALAHDIEELATDLLRLLETVDRGEGGCVV